MADGHEAVSNVGNSNAGNTTSVGMGTIVNGDAVSVRVRDGGGERSYAPAGAGVADALRYEISEAQALLSSLADIVGDDDELAASTVEGETNLVEALNRAVNRTVELDGLIGGIAVMIDSARERKTRLEAQKARIRDLICIAMETAGMKKLETPLVTVSLKKVPPSLIVTSEADIPSSFWKQPPPTLDKRELLAALKDGPIAGAHLSNGGQTISFKAN